MFGDPKNCMIIKFLSKYKSCLEHKINQVQWITSIYDTIRTVFELLFILADMCIV